MTSEVIDFMSWGGCSDSLFTSWFCGDSHQRGAHAHVGYRL